MYYLVAILDMALVVAFYGAMRTGFGRALQSIRTDQMASAALGINEFLRGFALPAGTELPCPATS